MRGSRLTLVCVCFAIVAMTGAAVADGPEQHPLEPPDRSSPRATIRTFLDGIDQAWDLYSAGNPEYVRIFGEAKGCLDLREFPPLVLREASTKSALQLKEVLDRLQLPAADEMPDAAAVAESGITRWAVPHTEITLFRVPDGDREGEWLFSAGTVFRINEFYSRVRHLPYQPGRSGGHVEELSAGTKAVMLMKLAEVMPGWFSKEVGEMMVWQWFGLGLLVVLLALAIAGAAWVGRWWRSRGFPGKRLTIFFVPLMMVGTPLIGRVMIGRLFPLPGESALMLRLVLSIVGYAGLAYLVGIVLTRIGEITVRVWFRDARPLKKQLVRVIFRVATIAVITGITAKALQILGVPVAGVVAGLGVGGLAIALAAQGTLENFIGGIILFADQPVRVGDVCNFGSRRGTVEDVGLRSVKLRTIDRTLVTVPNADFAKMQLENLSERDRVLMREDLHLQYGTSRKQIADVLSGIEDMLREHPRMTDDRLRVRFTGFGENSLEIEVFAYALTDAWPEFLEIRQDVLLKVMQIIEQAGTRLALPTEIHFVDDGRETLEPESHQECESDARDCDRFDDQERISTRSSKRR